MRIQHCSGIILVLMLGACAGSTPHRRMMTQWPTFNPPPVTLPQGIQRDAGDDATLDYVYSRLAQSGNSSDATPRETAAALPSSTTDAIESATGAELFNTDLWLDEAWARNEASSAVQEPLQQYAQQYESLYWQEPLLVDRIDTTMGYSPLTGYSPLGWNEPYSYAYYEGYYGYSPWWTYYPSYPVAYYPIYPDYPYRWGGYYQFGYSWGYPWWRPYYLYPIVVYLPPPTNGDERETYTAVKPRQERTRNLPRRAEPSLPLSGAENIITRDTGRAIDSYDSFPRANDRLNFFNPLSSTMSPPSTQPTEPRRIQSYNPLQSSINSLQEPLDTSRIPAYTPSRAIPSYPNTLTGSTSRSSRSSLSPSRYGSYSSTPMSTPRNPSFSNPPSRAIPRSVSPPR